MRIEVTHVAGPVPVKRQGMVETATLPPAERKAVEATVRGAVRSAGTSGNKRPADVGSCEVKVTRDDGSTEVLKFSEAEATEEQTNLLQALRPFLKVTPWR
jgi:hypothetical protein